MIGMRVTTNSKLGEYILKINERFSDLKKPEQLGVFGVTNKEGVVYTGVPPSDDLSNYIVVGERQFVYNPYRINVGSIGLTPKGFKGVVSPAYVVFETKDELDPEYLFLYLKSERGINLVNHYGNRGGVRDALRYDALSEIDFPFVDLPTQKSIVARLQSLQSLHREADATLARLKADVKRLRQSILQDAIQGKLTDCQPAPGEKTGTALLTDIRAEKERRAREAGKKPDKPLPPVTPEEMPFELPEGWVWCRLGDVTYQITDGTHQTPTYTLTGRTFLSAQNVKPFRFLPEKHQFVSEHDYANYISNRKPEFEDVLVARVGAGIGEAAVIDKEIEFAFYVSLGLIKPIKIYLNPNLLATIFNSPYGVKYSKASVRSFGASAGNFNLERIRSFPIALPTITQQQQILSNLAVRLAQCEQLENHILILQAKTERLWKSELQQTFQFESNG
jgi:type I restriction enzyme, S subunit